MAVPLVPSCHLLQKSQHIQALGGLVWQLSSFGLCILSRGICSCGETHLQRLPWLGSKGQSCQGRVTHSRGCQNLPVATFFQSTLIQGNVPLNQSPGPCLIEAACARLKWCQKLQQGLQTCCVRL